MITLDHIKQVINNHRSILKRDHRVNRLEVFGSYARGVQTAQSDLDLLVEFNEPVSLLDWIGAENYLSDLLGVKVDLVLRKNIRPELKDIILNDAVEI